jgi:phosphatidylglycerophosphate synthase
LNARNAASKTFLGQGTVIAATLGILLAVLPFAGSRGPLVALAVFAMGVFLAIPALERHHAHSRFGLANTITYLRLGGVALFAGLAAESSILTLDSLAWLAVFGAVVLLTLDGFDGWSARRQGLASEFGARFDMEVDAAFILVLSVMALSLGKVGAWVLWLGLMRYAFVIAGEFAPALKAPLPPSTRRKTVCVVQILALTMLLVPQITADFAAVIAGGALIALAWSFAVDVVWILRGSR